MRERGVQGPSRRGNRGLPPASRPTGGVEAEEEPRPRQSSKRRGASQAPPRRRSPTRHIARASLAATPLVPTACHNDRQPALAYSLTQSAPAPTGSPAAMCHSPRHLPHRPTPPSRQTTRSRNLPLRPPPLRRKGATRLARAASTGGPGPAHTTRPPARSATPARPPLALYFLSLNIHCFLTFRHHTGAGFGPVTPKPAETGCPRKCKRPPPLPGEAVKSAPASSGRSGAAPFRDAATGRR